MKFVVLVITYSSSNQTLRPIKSASKGEFNFYISFNKRNYTEAHRKPFSITDVYFVIKRIDIKLAAYSTGKAAIGEMRQICSKDDFIFQTTARSFFKDKIVNKNYRYTIGHAAEACPNVFVFAGFERILASEHQFDREFSIHDDEKIFDLIDNAKSVAV